MEVFFVPNNGGMNLFFRGIMNSLTEISSAIPVLVKQVHPDPEVQINELMEYDYFSFFCWLATIDAEVSNAEVEFIDSCYPETITQKDIMQEAMNNQWIGKQYLQELPACLPLFVEADNFLYDNKSSRAGTLTKAWYDSYESLGKSMVLCDKRTNLKTETALDDFLFMCRSYIDRHAKWNQNNN